MLVLIRKVFFPVIKKVIYGLSVLIGSLGHKHVCKLFIKKVSGKKSVFWQFSSCQQSLEMKLHWLCCHGIYVFQQCIKETIGKKSYSEFCLIVIGFGGNMLTVTLNIMLDMLVMICKRFEKLKVA